MKTYLVLSVVMGCLMASPLYARDYEICKGQARDGAGITLTGNYNDPNRETIEINADGKRETYAVQYEPSGDVEESFSSPDHGGLKTTFYDENNSASGWTSELGPFKLRCE